MSRFYFNNRAENITSSSELATNPIENLIDKRRAKTFKFAGNFKIDNTNNKIYFNDGSDKTITLTNGNYLASALISHIVTKLNDVSSNWYGSYSTTSFNFSIGNSNSVTLRFSETINAVWNTIGFDNLSNESALEFIAPQQRNHFPHEFIAIDFGAILPATGFFLIGKSGELFSLSNSANVKLKANNIELWDSPPLEINIDVESDGIYFHIDKIVNDTHYRFWRIEIEDMFNFNGPEIELSYLYLGDHGDISRNLQNGFTASYEDMSEEVKTISGAKFHYELKKYLTLSNVNFLALDKADRDTLTRAFLINGISNPFFIAIDENNCISNLPSEFCRMVNFSKEFNLKHIIYDKFTLDLQLSEWL